MPKTYPSYDRFPGDYLLTDIAFLSMAAQGLWLRLEDLMHASERYGYLQSAGKAMPDALVARKVSLPLAEYLAILKEMDDAGWIKRTPQTKIIYSETLINQDEKRSGARHRKQNSLRTLRQLSPNSPETLPELRRK